LARWMRDASARHVKRRGTAHPVAGVVQMAPRCTVLAAFALLACSLKLASAVPKSRFNRPIKDEQLEKVGLGGVTWVE